MAVCQALAGSDVVLVGHSLECDLHALRVSLPKRACVLDTALLFPLRSNPRGPPSKAALRNLSVWHLRREIQQPRPQANSAQMLQLGHSPTEDAQAAMDLAVVKLTNGLAFGTPDGSWGAGYEALQTVKATCG